MKSRIIFHRNGKRSYFIDGLEVTAKEYRRRTKKRVGGKGSAMISKAYNRPLLSKAMGVHPSQVSEFRELARASGNTGVDYLPDGRAVFETRDARRKELQRSGLVDRDGCYGDG